MDSINIAGGNLGEIDHFKVDLKITYKGFPEVDTRCHYSKATLLLNLQKLDGNKMVFTVSQPYLDFGFEKECGVPEKY